MGYTADDSMVRVDFFKPTGKWYVTEAVKWTGRWEESMIHEEFAKSLHDHLVKTDNGALERGHYRLSAMVAICLEPYHKFAHPISLVVGQDLLGLLERCYPECVEEFERLVASKVRAAERPHEPPR